MSESVPSSAERAAPKPLYVGTMNDGLFIIDQPPRPAPKDYDTGTLHKVNVIATMANNDREASAQANRFAAANELYEAAVEFVRKVECGEARSKRSYAAFKAALTKAEGR